MTNDSSSPDKEAQPRRVKRDVPFMIRFSRAEKDMVEASAKGAGYETAADYIRNRLFAQPPLDDEQREGPEFLTEKQHGEIAVAVLHLYRIFEDSFGEKGAGDKFTEQRREVIDALDLQELLGTGR